MSIIVLNKEHLFLNFHSNNCLKKEDFDKIHQMVEDNNRRIRRLKYDYFHWFDFSRTNYFPS